MRARGIQDTLWCRHTSVTMDSDQVRDDSLVSARTTDQPGGWPLVGGAIPQQRCRNSWARESATCHSASRDGSTCSPIGSKSASFGATRLTMAILHPVVSDAVHVDRPPCAHFGSRRSEVQILSPRLMETVDLHDVISRRPAIDSLGVLFLGKHIGGLWRNAEWRARGFRSAPGASCSKELRWRVDVL